MSDEARVLKHGDLTYKIIGIFYDVYNDLGYGFLESVYEEAMCIALAEAGIYYQRQVPVPVWFRGRRVGDFKADILVEGVVVLELKAARAIEAAHEAQVLHYLKATHLELGLLLNFGMEADVRRLLFDNARKKLRIDPCKSVDDPCKSVAKKGVS